jgi:hypothetical protein
MTLANRSTVKRRHTQPPCRPSTTGKSDLPRQDRRTQSRGHSTTFIWIRVPSLKLLKITNSREPDRTFLVCYVHGSRTSTEIRREPYNRNRICIRTLVQVPHALLGGLLSEKFRVPYLGRVHKAQQDATMGVVTQGSPPRASESLKDIVGRLLNDRSWPLCIKAASYLIGVN